MNSLNRLFRCIAIVTLLGSFAAQATELRVPEAVTLVTPIPGYQISPEIRVRLVWEASENYPVPSWFRVSILTQDGTTQTLWTQDDHLYLNENSKIGSYRWWVEPWNEQGFGKSSESYFSIHPYHPGTVVNLAPNGSEFTAVDIDLYWELTKTSASQNLWSKIIVFRNGAHYRTKWVKYIPTPTILPGPNFSLATLETLESGAYRWWVCPWDGVYGTWSEGASFTVDLHTPEAPTSLISQQLRGEEQAILSWEHDHSAEWYQVWIGQPGQYGSYNKWHKADDIVSRNNASITAPLKAWGQYNCYVRSWNSKGMGPWSDASSFEMGLPIQLEVADGMLVFDDSNCEIANYYNFKLGPVSDPNGEYHPFNESSVTKDGNRRSIAIWKELAPGDYHWWVRCDNDGGTYGHSSWAGPFVFTVPSTIPCPIAKTGQTTEFIQGDDGAHQAGIAWPEPRFVETGNGTVIDMLTGLEWVKEPHALPGNEGTHSWSTAVAFCHQLEFADHSDWHLPNLNEIRTLIHYGKVDHNTEWLNSVEVPFSGLITETDDGYSYSHYWTSTTHGNELYDFLAWGINLQTGFCNADETYKDAQVYVLPVRISSINPSCPVLATGQTKSYQDGDDGYFCYGEKMGEERFTATTEGTVIDNLTGLEWIQAPHLLPNNEKTTLEENFAFCETLEFAEKNDWRIPTISELLSIQNGMTYDPPGEPFILPETGFHLGHSTTTADDIGSTYLRYSFPVRILETD